MISIVIPAYNEEKVIGRCLSALNEGNTSGLLDIIVVCNGCIDKTAETAAEIAPEATIIIINEADKAAALNIGIENCKYEKVLLLDADVIFSIRKITTLLKFMEENNYLVVTPSLNLKLTHSSFLNRNYYEIANKLPYLQGAKISHVILLSEEGVKRIGKIPKVIADDNYIRLKFSDSEKATLADISYEMNAPTSYWGLVKILTRSHLGNIELYKKYPEISKRHSTDHEKALLLLILRPRLYISLVIFVFTKLIARIRASFQFVFLDQYQWEKDESSRSIK